MPKIPDNQIDNLDKWMVFFKKNGKFPHKKIVCTKCQNVYISIVGAGLGNLKKQFNGKIKDILTKAVCKTCKNESLPESKKIEPKVLTRDEMEDRAEEIRKNIPKIDLQKPNDIFNLIKNKEICQKITETSCWRPDIYLDLGCSSCKLVQNCKCSIKNLKRKPIPRKGKLVYLN
jgi:hypothetical protein